MSSEESAVLRREARRYLESLPQTGCVFSAVEIQVLMIACGKLAEMMDDAQLDSEEQSQRVVLAVLAEQLKEALGRLIELPEM